MNPLHCIHSYQYWIIISCSKLVIAEVKVFKKTHIIPTSIHNQLLWLLPLFRKINIMRDDSIKSILRYDSSKLVQMFEYYQFFSCQFFFVRTAHKKGNAFLGLCLRYVMFVCVFLSYLLSTAAPWLILYVEVWFDSSLYLECYLYLYYKEVKLVCNMCVCRGNYTTLKHFLLRLCS